MYPRHTRIIKLQTSYGMVFPWKQQGDIGARRVELTVSSDRMGVSHIPGVHTHTQRRVIWCDVAHVSGHRYSPQWRYIPGQRLTRGSDSAPLATTHGSVHICFPSATRLTFLKPGRGREGRENRGGGWRSVLVWFNYYCERTFALGCLSEYVCMHLCTTLHCFFLSFFFTFDCMQACASLLTAGVGWSFSNPQ